MQRITRIALSLNKFSVGLNLQNIQEGLVKYSEHSIIVTKKNC